MLTELHNAPCMHSWQHMPATRLKWSHADRIAQSTVLRTPAGPTRPPYRCGPNVPANWSSTQQTCRAASAQPTRSDFFPEAEWTTLRPENANCAKLTLPNVHTGAGGRERKPTRRSPSASSQMALSQNGAEAAPAETGKTAGCQQSHAKQHKQATHAFN